MPASRDFSICHRPVGITIPPDFSDNCYAHLEKFSSNRLLKRAMVVLISPFKIKESRHIVIVTFYDGDNDKMNENDMLDTVQESIAHNIWTRFMSQDSVIYDYVGLDGEILLPTPEECRLNQPNALGWWTPIEDGAFFTGVYLLGRCDRYLLHRSEAVAETIRKLVGGLYKLQDVCTTPGMIARGVGSDGQCHYPASSNDQNIPWILGLWRYLATDIPTMAERDECRERLLRHLLALRDAHWKIPGEIPGFERGSLLHEDGLEGRLSSVHLAIVSRIMAAMLPEEESFHRIVMDQKLCNGRTRREIIGEGFTYFEPWMGWFTATSQYAVRELLRLETDTSNKDRFHRALTATGKAAAGMIARYKRYQPGRVRDFTPDWRVMLSAWQPQINSEEAVRVAGPEHDIWGEKCPAVKEDKDTMMASLAFAWIVMMS